MTDLHVREHSGNELRENEQGNRAVDTDRDKLRQAQVNPPRDESFAVAVKDKPKAHGNECFQTERATSFPQNPTNLKEQAIGRGSIKSLVVLMGMFF